MRFELIINFVVCGVNLSFPPYLTMVGIKPVTQGLFKYMIFWN